MANLSQAQIAMYARSAGMANPELMAAIAMAESGGNPNAHNVIPPDNSYGLWQINMYGSMGPSRRAQYGLKSNDELFNPSVNAKAAAAILKGQGPSAWSTYTSGAYKKYYSGGVVQTSNKDNGLGGDIEAGAGVVGDGASAVADGVEVVVKGAEWVSNPSNWARVAYVILGGGVVIVGLAIAAKSSPTVNKAVTGIAKGMA